MIKIIRTIYSRVLDKGLSSMFCVGFRVTYKTPEEGWRTYRPKRCEYNNEDKSLNILINSV